MVLAAQYIPQPFKYKKLIKINIIDFFKKEICMSLYNKKIIYIYIVFFILLLLGFFQYSKNTLFYRN